MWSLHHVYELTCGLEFRIGQKKVLIEHKSLIFGHFLNYVLICFLCFLVNTYMTPLPWRLGRVLCSSFFIHYILHNKIRIEQHPKGSDEESSAHLRFWSSRIQYWSLPVFVLCSGILAQVPPKDRAWDKNLQAGVILEGNHRKPKWETAKRKTKEVWEIHIWSHFLIKKQI